MFYNNPATRAAFQAGRSWEARAQHLEDALSQSPVGQARGRTSLHPSLSAEALCGYHHNCLVPGKGAVSSFLCVKDMRSMRMELCSCPRKDEGLIRFLALGIKTLTVLVLVVLPNQHGYKRKSDCIPPPPAAAGWFMVAISLPVSGRNFFCLRCPWCPVPSVMHYPAERDATAVLARAVWVCSLCPIAQRHSVA